MARIISKQMDAVTLMQHISDPDVLDFRAATMPMKQMITRLVIIHGVDKPRNWQQ